MCCLLLENLNENNVINALAFIVFDFVKSEKKATMFELRNMIGGIDNTSSRAQMSEMTNYLVCVTYEQTLRRNNFTKYMDYLF